MRQFAKSEVRNRSGSPTGTVDEADESYLRSQSTVIGAEAFEHQELE